MAHHEVLECKAGVIFLGLIFDDAHHVGIEFLSQNTTISVVSAIAYDEDDPALLFDDDFLWCFDDSS